MLSLASYVQWLVMVDMGESISQYQLFLIKVCKELGLVQPQRDLHLIAPKQKQYHFKALNSRKGYEDLEMIFYCPLTLLGEKILSFKHGQIEMVTSVFICWVFYTHMKIGPAFSTLYLTVIVNTHTHFYLKYQKQSYFQSLFIILDLTQQPLGTHITIFQPSCSSLFCPCKIKQELVLQCQSPV